MESKILRKRESARQSRARLYGRIDTLEAIYLTLTGTVAPGWKTRASEATGAPKSSNAKQRNRISAARSRQRRRSYVCWLEARCSPETSTPRILMLDNSRMNYATVIGSCLL